MGSSAQNSQKTQNEGQDTKRGFREMTWIRAGLGMGSALLVQELASDWGQHLSPTELYPLSLAVGMSFYNLHLLNPIPASDHRSRLRALWLPQQKKQALGLSFLLLIASMFFYNMRQSRTINELQINDIKALRPIDRGLYKISGTPQNEENPYRWVFNDHLEAEEAPYLIPLEEFKGQVLVVSKTEFREPLERRVGLVSELSSFARPHYIAYRNYMGITPNAPIYLFDIRGLWWFDPQAIAAIIMSALLFAGVLGSATRDPENDSRLLFIPPELRVHLDMTDLSESELEQNQTDRNHNRDNQVSADRPESDMLGSDIEDVDSAENNVVISESIEQESKSSNEATKLDEN